MPTTTPHPDAPPVRPETAAAYHAQVRALAAQRAALKATR